MEESYDSKVKLNKPQKITDNYQRSETEIQTWLISYLAELLKIETSEIDIDCNFDRYGLDSSAAAVMIGDLDEWLVAELDPTLVYDYPTIQSLAQYLSK